MATMTGKMSSRGQVTRVSGVLLQVTGAAAALWGVWLLLGVAWTAIIGGVIAAGVGVLREAGWI